ncbi:TMEM175 family protein [Streptomyces sp. NPDC058992]|uniref:TMEM175 family protein n=1 Tax=Streptomyces sp. NPDC058992 TaxID=3346688 RepID=UPI0036C44A51
MSTPTPEWEDETPGAIIGPDRLLAFGDAVFAIAITLLALDITVPGDLEVGALGTALHRALSDIGAYLLSFVVIGVLWLSQHTLFHRVARLDSCLLYLYLALLAVIAALPFPTRLISEYADTTAATAVYAGSIAVASGLITAMTLRLLLRPALATPGTVPRRLRIAVYEGLVMVVVFAASVPLAFVSPKIAQYWWLAAIPARVWLSHLTRSVPPRP